MEETKITSKSASTGSTWTLVNSDQAVYFVSLGYFTMKVKATRSFSEAGCTSRQCVITENTSVLFYRLHDFELRRYSS
jgi:hypothetical protein